MKSCAFFGHRNMNVEQYQERLLKVITYLIEKKDVGQFYSGYRGDFDVYCSRLIYELKKVYPQIKNTMVLSYIPKDRNLPNCFDDSVYLLEKRVPEKFAIIKTNKRLADKVDFIIAGVYTVGGAFAVCEYARKRKTVINVTEEWNE